MCAPLAIFLSPCVSIVSAPLLSRCMRGDKHSASLVSLARWCGPAVCLARCAYCFFACAPEITKTIEVGARQSVLIQFDSGDQRVQMECFVRADGREAGHGFSVSDRCVKGACAVFVVSSVALYLCRKASVVLTMPLACIAASSLCYVFVALAQKVDDHAWEAGETDAGAFARDVQRQYSRRRCRGPDAVPFTNHSDNPVTLRVKFSAEGLFAKTKDIDINYSVLESDSILAVFDAELSPNMRQLLSNSTAAYRRIHWAAPPVVSFLVGAVIYGVFFAVSLFGARWAWGQISAISNKGAQVEKTVQEWKWFQSVANVWKFVIQRGYDLLQSVAGDDPIQQVNYQNLDKSRDAFFELLKQNNIHAFASIEAEMEKWQKGRVSRSSSTLDEDKLFKNLDNLWTIWSSSKDGELGLKNALFWPTINFYNAMMTKNEVHSVCL